MTDNQKTTVIKVCPRCGREDDKGTIVCPVDGTALMTKKVDPLIGKTIADKYEILSSLGKGGMSIVYKGKHKLMDRIVAVKLLRPELVAIPQLVERFKRESKAISTLRHPNIVAVFDFGLMQDATPFLIMDYLEGKTLDKVLKEEGKLDIHRACALVAEAADGLAHSHHAGIVHRDIKPSNLLLRKEPNGKETLTIFDFGIAKLLSQDGQTIHKLTASGEIFGSPLYMSPEQSEGEGIGTKSDIYSLACVLHELLLGKPPFRGETPVETIMLHMSEPVKPFNQIDPNNNIPEELELVIVKALSKKPEDRFKTIEEFKDAVLAAIKDVPTEDQIDSSLHSAVPFDGDESHGDHGDNAANTPARPELPRPCEKSGAGSKIAKIATALIVVAGIAAVGMFGLKQYNEHQENQTKSPTETTKPADTNGGGTKPGDTKTDETPKANDPALLNGGKEKQTEDNKALIEAAKLKPLSDMRFLGITAPEPLNWPMNVQNAKLITERPEPLLKEPDETLVGNGRRKPGGNFVAFEVSPSELEPKEAAEGIFRNYFSDKAADWRYRVDHMKNGTGDKESFLMQEIRYRAEDGDNIAPNVKQFMVYFKDGKSLIAVQFYPTHATYDEIMQLIKAILPSIRDAIY